MASTGASSTINRRPRRKGKAPSPPSSWMIRGRYLRAQRQESFISVISGFSLVGIRWALRRSIIVMSVMNGFRAQLWAASWG